MHSGETSKKDPNKSLQQLLDRYSLVGGDDNLTIENLRTNNPRDLGQRAGYLYGELTAKGLVHVWADTDKSDYSNAEVLVVDHSFVSAGRHVYNRRTGMHDWYQHTGPYTSIPLENKPDALMLTPYDQVIKGLYGEKREQAHIRYSLTAKALAKFAALSGIYDALHQTKMYRYPAAPRNLEQLYPYAGQAFGPRINVEDMLRAGVKFHPSVAEALRTAPTMTIDD